MAVKQENNPYDELYGQIDFRKSPFGFDKKEDVIWRKSQVNRQIVKYLQKGTVLDNGGGYGFLNQFMDSSRNTYYNFDCSIEILKYDDSDLRCIGGDETLPYKDVVFDNVVSGDVLEHVQDKLHYLAESYRVLKRGGIFIVNTPREENQNAFKQSIWFWIPYVSRCWAQLKRIFFRIKTPPKINVPAGVVDIPSEEGWLRKQLENLGYEILVQSRTGTFLFGLEGFFWRKLADLFIDPAKYGHAVFFVCRKR